MKAPEEKVLQLAPHSPNMFPTMVSKFKFTVTYAALRSSPRRTLASVPVMAVVIYECAFVEARRIILEVSTMQNS